MRGYRYHQLLAQGKYLGGASARGRLVALGEYPGLLDGDGVVRGELYYFDDIDAALTTVDPVEGYNSADPERSLYLRVERAIQYLPAPHTGVTAFLYVYNGTVDSAPPVPDGDWRRFCADRSTAHLTDGGDA
jgi:gamma-glutamylcyclotransferase (GGCT)/AIG2-like uncharacterized protein YtfP